MQKKLKQKITSFFTITGRLRRLYQLQIILLCSVVGQLTIIAGKPRPTTSFKLRKGQDGMYLGITMYVTRH
jgi:hypothetical protein